MEQRGKLSWRADDAGLQLKEYVSVTLIRLRDFTHRTQINWLELVCGAGGVGSRGWQVTMLWRKMIRWFDLRLVEDEDCGGSD